MYFKFCRKNGFFSSLVASYLILATILLTFSFLFTRVVVNKIVDQHNSIYKYTLTDLSSNFETVINDMILSTSTISTTASKYNIDKTIPQNTINQAMPNYIENTLISKSGTLSHLGVYFPTYNSILSSNGLQPSDMYFIHFISNKIMYPQWLECINSSSHYFVFNYNSISSLFYTYKTNVNGIDAIFFSAAPMNKFYDYMNRFSKTSNTNLVIYNEKNSIILCNNGFTDAFSGYIKKNDNNYSGAKTIVTSGWSCYILYDNIFSTSPIKQIETATIVIIILSLIIAILLSVFFSKQQYKPIAGIVQQFKDNHIQQDSETNEFNFLKNAINNLLQNNNSFMFKNKKQKINDVLLNMIDGDANSEEIESVFSEFPNYAQNSFLVALLKITKTSLNNLNSTGYNKSDVNIIFINILEELVQKHYTGHVLSLNKGTFVCVISSNSIQRNVIQEIFEEAAYFIKLYFSIDFMVSISKSENGYKSIPALYNNAVDTMSLMEATGNKNLRFCDEFDFKISSTINYNIKDKLVNYIKTNNAAAASKIINKTIDEAVNSISTNDMLEQMFFKILSLLNYTLNSLLENENHLLINKYNPSSYIFPCENITQFKINIYNYFSLLSKNFTVQYSNNISLEQKICEYINDNFKNPNLDSALICNEFQIHNTYLSQIFAKKLNIGMHEYMTAVRINKSKEKLMNANAKIEDVALSVGYTNTRSFSRAFKRLEGISPSEFKVNHADKDTSTP